MVATLDGGVSAVKYDGFLLSGAASLTPSVRWDHPGGRGFISGRSTYLRFESGNRSIDMSVSGSWFTPPARHWRGELGIASGASDYASIASFSHGVAEARIHLLGAGRGGWISATLGRTSFGAGSRPVGVVAMGVWLLRTDLAMFAALDRSFIGDTAYTDVRSSARLQRGAVTFEGAIGARVLSRGGGRGVYGEATTTVPLGRRTAVVLSGGRYPTDAVSGSIAARYVTLALRLGAIGMRRAAPRALPVQIQPNSGSDGSTIDPPADMRLEMRMGAEDDVGLTIYAPGASAVEISGDFTDWRPVPLSRKQINGDAWEARFHIPRGIHRINVRRDGGPWMAPAGTTRSNDDYDGEVGVFVLP
ncbi:MAG TPA: glycogen-binding domain-containing protein [Gemmatimonadales bacterium]|nr:glycogen-binding domain-containing protein [Gemmatimonadales bacterium]